MCGRYNLEWNAEDEHLRVLFQEIRDRYQNDPLLSEMKTGEIFPTNLVPALLENGQAGLAYWGYPKWDGKGHIINARSETAHERPMFKSGKPCLLPASGYYEWAPAQNGGRKTKMYFTEKQSPVMYLAGLYRSRKAGAPEFVILTRAADTGPDEVHDRMPVIIPERSKAAWLQHRDAHSVVQADGLNWAPA